MSTGLLIVPLPHHLAQTCWWNRTRPCWMCRA